MSFETEQEENQLCLHCTDFQCSFEPMRHVTDTIRFYFRTRINCFINLLHQCPSDAIVGSIERKKSTQISVNNVTNVKQVTL